MARTRNDRALRWLLTLALLATHYPGCHHRLWTHSANYRTITTLGGVTRLRFPSAAAPTPPAPRVPGALSSRSRGPLRLAAPRVRPRRHRAWSAACVTPNTAASPRSITN